MNRFVPFLLAATILLFPLEVVLGQPSVDPRVLEVPPEADFVPEGLVSASGVAFIDPIIAERFQEQGTQIVIVVARTDSFDDVAVALAQKSLQFHEYDQLRMFSVLLPRDSLDDVATIPGVEVLYHNERMSLSLDRAADFTASTVVWKTYGIRGQGLAIMIVDSGVDGTHPDVKLGENLVQNVLPVLGGTGLLSGQSVENTPLTDFDGHGTHVASIAGGTALVTAERGKYKGIAHEADLIGFAAGLEDPTTGEVSFESQTVLEAFNYAIANQKKYGIRIVSNSWGANGDFDARSPINIASLQMYKAGMVVVFAAGNEGADGEHTLNKYSVAPWVLCVAAGDYLNKLASFSSRGTDPASSGLAYDHPDIMAPGVAITAAKSSAEAGSGVTNPYTTKSGTSMAAPHVSGIAGLLLQANPKLSPDEVMDILVSTSTPVSGYDVWESGRGYVNALNAHKTAMKAPGTLDTFLSGKVKYAGAESNDPEFTKDPVSVGYGAGAASQLASGSQTIEEFGTDLVSTTQGWIFLAGLLILTPLSFRLKRSA